MMREEEFSLTTDYQWIPGALRPLTKEEKRKSVCKANGYCWVVVREYVCILPDEAHNRITVPVGFLTDGSTGGPDVGCAWLFHDWLYATHSFDNKTPCTRAKADQIMSAILQADRMTMYDRVARMLCRRNPFYLFSRAWTNSHRRGAQFLNEIDV